MQELREFVYIDDVSVNSHLSSLGRGVPSEVVHSFEDETEKGGEGGGTFWGIGAKGRYANIGRSGVERTLSITEPYRFEDLLEAIKDEEIDIHTNPDPRSVKRGDVVRIEGDTIPMSLFKFEVAIKTIRRILNTGTQEALDELDEDDEDVDIDDVDDLPVIEKLIEEFTGEKVPLRMVTDDWSYGVPLDRENMKIAPAEAFLEEQEYTLIGRAERQVLSGDQWDPILATSVLQRYLPGTEATTELRQQLEEIAREMNMAIEDEDWVLKGHTAIIHPIAMFW